MVHEEGRMKLYFSKLLSEKRGRDGKALALEGLDC